MNSAKTGHSGFHVLDHNTSKSFLDDVETLMFDCDGVLWKGSSLIPGADKVRKEPYLDTTRCMHRGTTRRQMSWFLNDVAR